MAQVTISHRRIFAFIERLDSWFAEWRRLSREVMAHAELERKLRGVDDHLLRDMGLKWTGRRLERISRDDGV
jgi:hypothetical protein